MIKSIPLISLLNSRPAITIALTLALILVQENVHLPDLNTRSVSGNEAQVLGSLFGALIGSLGAYIAAIYTVRKQNQYQERSRQEVVFINYINKNMECITLTKGYMVSLVLSIHRLEAMISPPHMTAFIVEMPFLADIEVSNVHDLVNLQLVNQWIKLMMRKNYDQARLKELNSTYNLLRDNTYAAMITGEQVNTNYIETTHQQLIKLADTVKLELKNQLDVAIRTLALCMLHDMGDSKIKIASPNDLKVYEVDDHRLNVKVTELTDLYDIAKPVN